MTKAAYRRKLLGLVWRLKKEIALVAAALVETARELEEIYKAIKEEDDPDRKKELLEKAGKVEERLKKLRKLKEELEAEKKAAEEDLKQNK